MADSLLITTKSQPQNPQCFAMRWRCRDQPLNCSFHHHSIRYLRGPYFTSDYISLPGGLYQLVGWSIHHTSGWTLVMSLEGSHMTILKRHVMANHTHTWWWNRGALKTTLRSTQRETKTAAGEFSPARSIQLCSVKARVLRFCSTSSWAPPALRRTSITSESPSCMATADSFVAFTLVPNNNNNYIYIYI